MGQGRAGGGGCSRLVVDPPRGATLNKLLGWGRAGREEVVDKRGAMARSWPKKALARMPRRRQQPGSSQRYAAPYLEGVIAIGPRLEP